MPAARRADDEAARLAALQAYGILDTEEEEVFDRIARLAQRLCETPVALITMVDEDRQWYKACIGVDVRETDRSLSICAHAILQPDEVTQIPDTTEDERTLDNPQVTGEPGFRFYAGAPVTTPGGHPLGTVCVLDDRPRSLDEEQLAGLEDLAALASTLIEERYGAASVERERSFLASVLDALDEHVAILDEEGTIVATNEAWDRFAEAHDADPGPGTAYQAAIRTDEDEIAREAHAGVQALLDGEEDTFELEYPCHGPDEQRFFHLTATGFEDGDRRYVVTAHRNVTAATLAEQQRERLTTQLSERDQMLQQLGRTLPQVLWIVDPDLDRFHFLGERATDFWQLDRGTLEEKPLAWLDRLAPADQERFQPWMQETLAAFHAGEEQDATFQFRFERPGDDEPRWGRIHAIAIQQDGELTQIAGITEDTTTSHREIARERRQARQAARLAELEQLVFATSHTLKTEVRRIRSYGQLLRSRAASKTGDLDEPVREMLEGSHRLEELHEGLREYAEVTQGRGTVERVDLVALVREVLAERSPEIEAAGGAAVLAELPDVLGDPDQLRRLFAEFVDNAIKFAGEAPPRLTIRGTRQRDTVELQVADEGIGFDPAYADKIFEIFQQLDPPHTDGVGIGLTIVQRIVENHDGTIHAEGRPGEGATFTFTLPEADTDEVPDPAPS